MNWIDTRLGLTRDQWVVIGLMGSALAWFVVLGVIQTDEAEAAGGALISAPPQGLLVHAVLSQMDSRGPFAPPAFPLSSEIVLQYRSHQSGFDVGAIRWRHIGKGAPVMHCEMQGCKTTVTLGLKSTRPCQYKTHGP